MSFGDDGSEVARGRLQRGNHALLHASPLRASTREAQYTNVNASDPALWMGNGMVKSRLFSEGSDTVSAAD
jgi:hypothetical protein